MRHQSLQPTICLTFYCFSTTSRSFLIFLLRHGIVRQSWPTISKSSPTQCKHCCVHYQLRFLLYADRGLCLHPRPQLYDHTIVLSTPVSKFRLVPSLDESEASPSSDVSIWLYRVSPSPTLSSCPSGLHKYHVSQFCR